MKRSRFSEEQIIAETVPLRPTGLRYSAHCLNRAHAQQHGLAAIPAGTKWISRHPAWAQNRIWDDLCATLVRIFQIRSDYQRMYG